MEVTAATPGVDYRATFEVPVFKTEESRPDFELDDSLLEQYAAPHDSELEFSRSGISRLPAPGGQGDRFIFPMGRHVGVILGLLVFMAAWTGGIALMLHVGAPWFFIVVFGLIDLLIGWGLLDLLFYRSVVDASPHVLLVQGGLLGMGRTRTILPDEIKKLELRSRMQSGQTKYYNVVVITTDDRDVTLGKRLRGRRTAECVLQELEQSLGRAETES